MPEPGWLEPLLAADEMRALDAWAIEECGVPSLDLMETAGTGVARLVGELSPDGAVRVVCGKGNNGGDGLVATRRLRESGYDAEALLLWPPEELSDDARTNHDRLREAAGSVRVVHADTLPEALDRSAIIVDALLGTGFSGSPRPPLDRAISAINERHGRVVAVDVPSGVDASTGEVADPCVQADITVTFHAPKVGLWVMPGKAHAGRVDVIDIGIPSDGRPERFKAGLIASSVLDLVPRRGKDSTKFSSGSLLVVGGSTGLTGAVCLACEAAMRAGAGWVRAAVPSSLNVVFEQKLTEVMSLPLPDEDGSLLATAADAVLEAAERADAVVLGPGLGRADTSFELAARVAAGLERPLLLDADGLNALAAAGLGSLARRSAPTVLTPHAGELARLLRTESAEVAARRLAHARATAAESAAVVVLKGDDSLVSPPEKDLPVAVNPGGSPGLASAGTGDVLSGVLGAFLAKALGPFEAACAAVYAHSRAGALAADELGAESVIASDVIEALPRALRRSG